MKVLMINVVCGIRSTGRICTDIADVLEANGHECKIAYGRETVPEKYQKYSVRIDTDTQIKINGAKTRLFDNEGFNAKRQTEKLIDFIKDYKPDIIHIHNLHGYYINISVLLTYLAESKIPIICTMHDCWSVTGHCAHFTTVGCEKWKTGCYDCPQKNAYPSSYLLDRSKKNWKMKRALYSAVKNMIIVTPSNWLADIMRQSYFGNRRIEVIPNGIDTEAFKPTESDFRKQHRLDNKKIVLGVATAWSESKGLKELIALQEKLGNSYQVVLVGLSKKQIEELPEGVLGIERTNSIQELAEIYTAADVFVNAGKEETMGLTTVEAMACGTPVVTSNLTAVPEVVEKDGGMVFDEYTVSAMAEKVRMVTSKKYNNTRNVAMKYDKEIQYMRYLDLYEKLVGGVIPNLWFELYKHSVSSDFGQEVLAA